MYSLNKFYKKKEHLSVICVHVNLRMKTNSHGNIKSYYRNGKQNFLSSGNNWNNFLSKHF